MPAPDLFLDTIFLKNRITELGIKQWWLAEQIGVDRKTVSRWLLGKVKAIQASNAQALALVLKCDIAELCPADAMPSLATAEEQRLAATLLASSSLSEKIGPVGEWDVIESLLKAVLIPDLPLNILGDLYHQLTVASWRQSKLDQAQVYNDKALGIAEKTGDKVLLAQCLLSRGNLCSWRGQIGRAIKNYESCLELSPFLDEKILGSVFSNLGAVLYESGDLPSGLRYQDEALIRFALHGTQVNFSVAHAHRALIFLQMKSWHDASEATALSRSFAEQADYRRGMAMCGLIESELLARAGNERESLAKLERALKSFEALKIREGLNFEFAGRVCRLLGRSSEALEYLREGLKAAANFPVDLAGVLAELSYLTTPDKLDYARRAIELYEGSGATLKASALRSVHNI